MFGDGVVPMRHFHINNNNSAFQFSFGFNGRLEVGCTFDYFGCKFLLLPFEFFIIYLPYYITLFFAFSSIPCQHVLSLFFFLNPLVVRSVLFRLFASHIPDHAGRARSRRRASTRRGEAPLQLRGGLP